MPFPHHTHCPREKDVHLQQLEQQLEQLQASRTSEGGPLTKSVVKPIERVSLRDRRRENVD